MRMGFEGGIKLEFHGTKVTSDGGLLAYRELDDALGLFDAVSTALSDQRSGRNIQHAMPTLLRQRYERGERNGYRSGHKPGKLDSAEGRLPVALPQVAMPSSFFTRNCLNC